MTPTKTQPMSQAEIAKVMKGLGWRFRDDGIILNYWGAPVKELPDLNKERLLHIVVVEYFTGFNSRVKGREQAFFNDYNNDMTARETCKLALRVIGEHP